MLKRDQHLWLFAFTCPYLTPIIGSIVITKHLFHLKQSLRTLPLYFAAEPFSCKPVKQIKQQKKKHLFSVLLGDHHPFNSMPVLGIHVSMYVYVMVRSCPSSIQSPAKWHGFGSCCAVMLGRAHVLNRK